MQICIYQLLQFLNVRPKSVEKLRATVINGCYIRNLRQKIPSKNSQLCTSFLGNTSVVQCYSYYLLYIWKWHYFTAMYILKQRQLVASSFDTCQVSKDVFHVFKKRIMLLFVNLFPYFRCLCNSYNIMYTALIQLIRITVILQFMPFHQHREISSFIEQLPNAKWSRRQHNCTQINSNLGFVDL